MKKILVVVTLLAACVHAPISIADPLGYPGSAWASVFGPAATTGIEKDNILFQGKVEQGIDWFHLDDNKRWTLNTYASFGYSADTEALGYNNKAVPALGVKVKRDFNTGVLEIGVQLIHENRWIDDISGNGVQAYVNIWKGWNLKK